MALPTETIYGLFADATDDDAVRAVFLAKGRPSSNPVIIHVDSIAMIEQYATIQSPLERLLLEKLTP
ncbi:Sua5/YciO/YrdC/YwlC family protein [Patescibacteria group bacterium]|nr:Sua5/YciO/YrdC/YwlC family protein [Patescibacteria group bacterium]